MSGRGKLKLEDRGAFLPSHAEIAARAAKIREDWSPRQFFLRSGGGEPPVSLPEYHSPDLPTALREAIGESLR